MQFQTHANWKTIYGNAGDGYHPPLANQTDPGGPLNDDPYGQAGLELLPASLMDSTDALDKPAMFRTALGDDFFNHDLAMKRHEIGRSLSHVTDWEHREHFEVF